MLGTPEIDVRSYDELARKDVTCHATFLLDRRTRVSFTLGRPLRNRLSEASADRIGATAESPFARDRSTSASRPQRYLRSRRSEDFESGHFEARSAGLSRVRDRHG